MTAFVDPAFAALTWDKTHRGTKLDLTGYKQTWRDDFSTLSIGGSSDTTARWKAPGRSDNVCGVAQQREWGYTPSPYRHHVDHMHIRAELINGVWQSGHMQTANRSVVGFAQQMGYFEMRAKFPRSKGAWPAFWLIGNDQTKPRAEVDAVEAYGGDWDGHHSAIHLASTIHRSLYTGFDTKPWCPPASRDMFNSAYHRYGALLTDQWIISYYDGLEVGRFPMTDYFRQPFYMLVTLALNPSQKDQITPEPKELLVDRVMAMAKA